MNKKLIKEGAEKAVAEFAGYTIYHKDGKWYQSKGDIKRGKGLTSDELWEKHGDAYKRHIESRRDPNADAVASGASPDQHESFDLFPKSDERLLREHIRAEYEARGIYPTSREVQETYNQVMSLLEKVSEEEKARREALRYGGTNKRKARREARTGTQFFKDEGERQAAHSAARGKRKVSPSSPARKQSRVEKDTRFLMGQGFSPDHLRRIMSDSGR